MQHTAEITDIVSEIIKRYGYGIFSNRKRISALCGDLMTKYPQERRVFQMLFQAGLGESFGKLPYSSEQELRLGLARINKFLAEQSIEGDTRGFILTVFTCAFAGKSTVPDGFLPEIRKNFNEVHFKINLPTIMEFQDRVQFKIVLTNKTVTGEASSAITTVLEKCVMRDRVGMIHESGMDYSLFPADKKMSNAAISVPEAGKKIHLNGDVEFTFLSSNCKKVIVSYTFKDARSFNLKQIAVAKMTDRECDKALQIIEMLEKARKAENRTADNSSSAAASGGASEGNSGYSSPNMNEFSDALRQEILFLKQGRGKKYKIINGSKIHNDRGVYTYIFEMETELHLPDDAPIRLETGGGFHAEGTVLICEDFQIMLLLDRDISDKVGSAFLMVEPWKLLEALRNRMMSLDPVKNQLAIRLIEEGPKLATKKDISGVPMGQDAVYRKLDQDDIITVWGPPGTGKTYTMGQIAVRYLKQGKTVLVVSHSNVSVDGVVKTVVNNVRSEPDMRSMLKAGKVLRFGYVRDDELSQDPYATSFNYAKGQCTSLSKELDRLTDEKDKLKAKNRMKSPEYDKVEKAIKKIREEIRKEERRYVERAQFIGTTISRATIDTMFEERQFDLVMFDEVSMAYVPQVVVAASLATRKFLCVGDFRQLAPISQSPGAQKTLQTDIFSYLKIIDSSANMYLHPWLIMLNEQRRMHPAISAFPNKMVYKNLLKDHPSVFQNRKGIVNLPPLSGDAVNLIDLTGTYSAASKNSDNSRYNILSAIVSFATAVNAEKNGMDSVGIITPYAAQTRLIRAMLRDYYDVTNTTVSCATVHQFQGSESDLIIFDAVESYPSARVGWLMGKEPDAVRRLINVAITRARGKLITVANGRFWDNKFKGTSHILYRLLEYIRQGHHVVQNGKGKELTAFLQTLNPYRTTWIYTDEGMALDELSKDINRARERIVVSIPDGNLRETAPEVLQMITSADRRGVDILMKSNDYAGLPDEWKRFCWGTENATFPLILIDDELIWFGLPTSKLRFHGDNNMTYITVVHAMVRIRGKNTVEMIKGLTELETIENGSTKRPLQTKTGVGAPKPIAVDSDEKDSAGEQPGSAGLAAFIEEKKFCSECKNHMVLTRGRTGKPYLKCSNKGCKHIDYLDRDTINWYITVRNPSCPRRDGGILTGRVGRYGPYIQCSCGHFLKPEEI